MDSPLVTVIVPIYNVEKYVRKCLDSLKGQTMKEIEIICIDDGSTDGSGEIADEYKSDEWPIFRIIHTENQGLSAARNRGLDEARAEWIMFVDSDDWVSPDFCRVPYEMALEYGANLVIFDRYLTSEKRIVKQSKVKKVIDIIDEYKAHEQGDTVVWNKLYEKRLFEGIYYPVNRVFEDYVTTHKLVHKAQMIVFVKERLYFHAERKDSITHTRTAENRRDCFVAALERNDDLISYGYMDTRPILCSAALAYLSSCDQSEEELYVKAKDIVESTQGIPRKLSQIQKIALISWRIDPSLFQLLNKASYKVHFHRMNRI